MNFISQPREIPNMDYLTQKVILERVLPFLDLDSLIAFTETSKTLCNLTRSLSDIWIMADRVCESEILLEGSSNIGFHKRYCTFLRIGEMFKVLVNLKIGKRYLTYDPLYSESYYLFMLRKFIELGSIWNFYDVLNNAESMDYLEKITRFLDTLRSNGFYYRTGTIGICYLKEYLGQISPQSKDEILKSIYIDEYYHNDQITSITVTNTRIRNMKYSEENHKFFRDMSNDESDLDKFSILWYPICVNSSVYSENGYQYLEADDFYAVITYSQIRKIRKLYHKEEDPDTSDEIEIRLIDKNGIFESGDLFHDVSDFHDETKKIANKLKVDPILFNDLVLLILTKGENETIKDMYHLFRCLEFENLSQSYGIEELLKETS